MNNLKLLFIAIIALLFIIVLNKLIQLTDKHDKIAEEWQQKVNACILDKNYRKDCDLIIYRDIQIHNERIESSQRSSAMTGAIMGGIIGASLGRK